MYPVAPVRIVLLIRVAVPARGADCIKTINKLNEAWSIVAVPARGADCIIIDAVRVTKYGVAVPARGADCIWKEMDGGN